MANEKKRPQNTSLDLNDISYLLETLEKHEVTEFRLEREHEKVWLKRGPLPQVAPVVMQSPYPPNYPQQASNQPPPPVTPQLSVVGKDAESVASESASAVPSKNIKEIRSPMVGTFYRRPAVDAEPFVEVGDSIKKGAVVCIIEAMKLMNEIESEHGGVISEVCLEDGQMVEYGEVLYKVEIS